MRDANRLAERLAELEDWRRDGFDAMLRWAEAVGVDERLVRINPQLAFEPTDVMLRDEDMPALPQEDFLWTVSHLMGLVAELLRDKHGGEWVVDEDPASPMYTDYLVVSGPKRFNPGLIVKAYIETAPPRDLRRALKQADELADRQVGLDAWRHEAARLAQEFAPIAERSATRTSMATTTASASGCTSICWRSPESGCAPITTVAGRWTTTPNHPRTRST